MKIVISTALLYILILSIFIGLSIIFNQPALLIFIFAFILLIPLSILIFINIHKSFEFNLSSQTEYIEIDNEINYLFSYKNKSIFPLFTANIEFHVENRFFPNNAIQNLAIPLSAKSSSIKIPVRTDKVGLVTLYLDKIIIHDYMYLIRKEFKPNLEVSVPVLPPKANERDIPAITPQDGLDEFEESDYKGNVSSDVKEIREYRPGDRLQRVHWKLSAKLDDLFVKEMAHTSTLSIVLLPELNKDRIYQTVSTLMGCIDTLNNREDRFELCCFNEKTYEFDYFTVTDEESILEAITFFYCEPLYEGTETALDTFRSSNNKPVTVIHILGNKISVEE